MKRGEIVLVVANEEEAKQYRGDGQHYIVNVTHGARAVEGMRVCSIDVTEKAARDERFFQVYQSLRHAQIMTRG